MSRKFLGHLDTRTHLPGEFVLINQFGYHSASGRVFFAPRGFITDFASIPRILHGLISPNGLSRKAAVIHDWLYCSQTVTRKQADDLFLEALEVCGVNLLQRYTMYAAVRSAGWIYWNRRSKNKYSLDYDVVANSYWQAKK